jgi:branched-chain amino acid transport system permease protein
MNEFIAALATGLFTGAAYAIAASGLVLTYTTTRVFNLGHGAIGMVMAFVYWQMTVRAHLSPALAIVLILFLIAPLLGVLLERLMMRGLGEAPVSVSLVVTIGLFVLLIGVAEQAWSPTKPRAPVPYFFGGKGFTLAKFVITWHYVLTIGLSVAVAAALYVLLNRTRVGTAMRAAVDNKELLELFGASSNKVSMASWAIGSSLAALAGIMLVAYIQLDYFLLTFLVINAFAAAMLGRLRSLPLTFVGAISLGLGQSFITQYLPTTPTWTGVQASLPTFMLFLVLIFVPQVRLRVGQVKGILAAPVPNLRKVVGFGALLIAITVAVVPSLNPTNTGYAGLTLTWAMVMLSLVLLTGYGGYVSLAQLSFMGIGAVVVAKMNTTSPMAIVVAVLITAAVGAAVALPVLRLTGLNLALATLAFAQLMDKLVFQSNLTFGFNGSLNAKRVDLFGLTFASTRSYIVFMAVVFVLLAFGVLALRRGAIGRLLIAMRDSPAACGTLGLNQRWFRVALFATSAGMAGLAGALYAGLRGTVSQLDFQAFNGLVVLLLAVVCGVTSVTGAGLGGLLYMLLPVLQSQYKSLAGLEFLIIGVGAISLGRDPNGIANYLFTWGRAVRSQIPMLSTNPPPKPAPAAGYDLDAEPSFDADYEEQVARHGVA